MTEPTTEPTTERPGPATPRCSARGCTADAVWALRWNNPRIHTPERRKVWLACDEHRSTLGDFLTARGFLKEVRPHSATDEDD
ncbi:hypothetical protein [Nocardioides sp. CFH 31398]|uniref:hypothetical protein n=1 Tax=Nocardioides sp. CFH 31398 TaxID=2919579 RepID=UPI001F051770|nr:hypothetical protein [Nocardioides sp. CFH 31398]MCH1866773.1 hypothetical protein [Nocardioides sp. CFH 31398]